MQYWNSYSRACCFAFLYSHNGSLACHPSSQSSPHPSFRCPDAARVRRRSMTRAPRTVSRSRARASSRSSSRCRPPFSLRTTTTRPRCPAHTRPRPLPRSRRRATGRRRRPNARSKPFSRKGGGQRVRHPQYCMIRSIDSNFPLPLISILGLFNIITRQHFETAALNAASTSPLALRVMDAERPCQYSSNGRET